MRGICSAFGIRIALRAGSCAPCEEVHKSSFFLILVMESESAGSELSIRCVEGGGNPNI